MLIDHIKKDGFIYRSAYPFYYKPNKVSLCLLPWRALIFGCLYLLYSFIMQVVIGLLFGILGYSVVSVYLLLIGRKLVYTGGEQPTHGRFIGSGVAWRISVFNYKDVPVKCLPVVAGKRVLPIYLILALLGIWVLWYVPVFGSVVWNGITWVEVEFMSLSLWMPFAILAFVVAVGLATHWIREFRKSEIYAILLMSFKARMDKICPIIPVK